MWLCGSGVTTELIFIQSGVHSTELEAYAKVIFSSWLKSTLSSFGSTEGVDRWPLIVKNNVYVLPGVPDYCKAKFSLVSLCAEIRFLIVQETVYFLPGMPDRCKV